MPKYTPQVAKAKAKKLIKVYSRNNFNQTKTAKELGVTQPCISDRLSKAPVQKTFAQRLDKAGITDNYLVRIGKEGLCAVRPDPLGPGILPDYNCRHKYWVTTLELKGHLKHNGNGKGISIVNIVYGHRDNRLANQPLRAIEGQPA